MECQYTVYLWSLLSRCILTPACGWFPHICCSEFDWLYTYSTLSQLVSSAAYNVLIHLWPTCLFYCHLFKSSNARISARPCYVTLPCISIQCLLITFYVCFGTFTAALYCTVFIICYTYFDIKSLMIRENVYLYVMFTSMFRNRYIVMVVKNRKNAC